MPVLATLIEGGADINFVSTVDLTPQCLGMLTGATPLFSIAVRRRQEDADMIRFLIEQGADGKNRCDVNGTLMTALQFARAADLESASGGSFTFEVLRELCCAMCGDTKKHCHLKRCDRCPENDRYTARYCSQECQVADWFSRHLFDHRARRRARRTQ